MNRESQKEYGGIAMEYLIVSGFGLTMTLLVMGFLMKEIKAKIEDVQKDWKASTEMEEMLIDP